MKEIQMKTTQNIILTKQAGFDAVPGSQYETGARPGRNAIQQEIHALKTRKTNPGEL